MTIKLITIRVKMLFKCAAKIFIVILCFSSFVFGGRVKRVIGGMAVPCGTEPRAASLRNHTTSEHLCGSMLLSPYVAITAAHCVQHPAPEYRLNLNNYCTPEKESVPTADVTEVIVHDRYDKYSRAHDIALLRVRINLEEISWLQVSVLPKMSFGLDGECILYGYGIKMLNTKETSEELLAARVNIMSMSECLRILGPYMAPEPDSGMMCAIGDAVDACEGDSGGPLIGMDGKVEGISSHGQSCGMAGIPGMYTSVRAHLQWIHKTLEQLNTSS